MVDANAVRVFGGGAVKITHVRLGALVSGPGYNNQSCAIEAQLDDGDDFDVVCAELRREIDGQIRRSQERDQLRQTVEELRQDVRYLEDQRAAFQKDIAAGRKIIRDHAELERLAREHGIDPKGLQDDTPF